ncbi:hypothetical protein SALBM135S_04939 [Streptomyces alboniger]
MARIDVRNDRRSCASWAALPTCAKLLARSVVSSTVRRASEMVRSTPRLAALTTFTVA